MISRCGTDRLGRSVCAELIRTLINVEPDVAITTVIPGDPFTAQGYMCGHGVTYWVPRSTPAPRR